MTYMYALFCVVYWLFICPILYLHDISASLLLFQLKVFELGESADPEGEGNLLGSGQEKAYHCDRTKTYRLLFEKPVLLKADWWYVAYAAISSPSGASTDAGSSGLSSIIGPDRSVCLYVCT